MTFVTVEWKNRQTQYPNRRTLTNVNDPSDVKTVTVERDEGNVTQDGTALNAYNMNNLETRISNMNDSLVGTAVTVTLPSSGWTQNASLGGYTQTVAVSGVTATSNQEILPLLVTSASDVQNNEALASAELMDYGQTTGNISLFAKNLPSTNLSIRVIVRA